MNRQKRKNNFLSRNKKTLYPDIQHWFFENSQVSKRRYSGFSSQKFEFSTCCFFHLEDSVKLSAMLQLKSFAMVIVCMCHWSNAAAACKPRRTVWKKSEKMYKNERRLTNWTRVVFRQIQYSGAALEWC